MERKHKIIIISLIIVIIALVVGLSYMLMGNGFSFGEESVPDGMQRYDFDSRFTMLVPDDARFLKEWNNSEIFGQSIIYFDKNNKFAVSYTNSPLIAEGFVDYTVEYANASGNATFEFDGDLIIGHSLKNNGKIGKTLDDSKFKYGVLLKRGHEFILINGNDLDSIKSMARSIEFYGDGD